MKVLQADKTLAWWQLRPGAQARLSVSTAAAILVRGSAQSGRCLFALNIAAADLDLDVAGAVASGEVLVLGGNTAAMAETCLDALSFHREQDKPEHCQQQALEALKLNLNLLISAYNPRVLNSSTPKNRTIGSSALALAELYPLLRAGMSDKDFKSLAKKLHKELAVLRGASAPGIDQIRAAEEWLRMTPSGKAKILVIRSLETLSDNASNSLLKLLEEPPRYARIICTTTRESYILPTLLSRLQIISLPALSWDEEQAILARDYAHTSVKRLAELNYYLEGIDIDRCRAHAQALIKDAGRLDESYAPESRMELELWLGCLLRSLSATTRDTNSLMPAQMAKISELSCEAQKRLRLNISSASVYEWLIEHLRSTLWM